MSGLQRQHCQSPEACKASKPTTHCRRCTMVSLNRDDALNVRRQATRLATPANVEKLRTNCAKVGRAWRATPEGQSRLAEIARANFALTQSPAATAKRRARDAEGGIKRTLRRVPGLPEAGVPLYRELTRKKKLSPVDALRIVLEETPGTPEHSRIAIAKIAADMRAKEARRKAQAY